MPDEKRTFAEFLLGLFASRERAAAIYGDLVELGQTRSRAWFLVAYIRTSLSLMWRPIIAFLAGTAVTVAILFVDLRDVLAQVFLLIAHPHLGPLFDEVRSELLFLVPFALVRYGIRDRVVKLSLGMLLATSGFYYLGLWCNFDPIPFASIACGLIVIACLIASTSWRVSLAPLAGAGVTTVVIGEGLSRIQWISDLDYRSTTFWVLVLVSMVLVALVFSRLHDWVHRRFTLSQLPGGVYV